MKSVSEQQKYRKKCFACFLLFIRPQNHKILWLFGIFCYFSVFVYKWLVSMQTHNLWSNKCVHASNRQQHNNRKNAHRYANKWLVFELLIGICMKHINPQYIVSKNFNDGKTNVLRLFQMINVQLQFLTAYLTKKKKIQDWYKFV